MNFSVSKETLPPSDHHDEMVKLTEARCAQLRELCWKMRDLVTHYHATRRNYESAISRGEPADLDLVMASYRDCSAMEREILNVRETIEKSVANYNFGRDTQKRIYVSHTAEGLPIRVSKSLKTPLWG